MRRYEKEITDLREIEEILDASSVLYLGAADRDGPYVVPLCFGYHSGSIFFHSASEGKKIRCLDYCSSVSFSCTSEFRIIQKDAPCRWTLEFRSISGYGTARRLASLEEKHHGMCCIMEHYRHTGTMDFPSLKSTEVYCIDIASMTGKKSLA